MNPSTVTKKHSPILCALSHILIFSAVYLYLRLYKRFFIALGLMVVVSFIPITYISLLAVIGVMIDTYLQTKGINEGTIQKEPFNNAKHIGGSLLLITLIVLSFLGRLSFLAWRQ